VCRNLHTGVGVPERGLAGLVLAAGGSRRLGRAKQLVLHRGETLVARASRLALGCCDAGVTVVTGAAGADVAAALRGLPVATCHNDAWAEGLAGSLACGVRAAPPGAAALLVMLCDQPLVAADDLERLAGAWDTRPEAMAAALYDGVPGVPAIFPRVRWPGLLELTGDRGAAALLRADPSRVTTVPMPAAALDVDDEAALRLLARDAGSA
jgi:CTP:molybdopterin cytidylyltransferase MocA